VLLQQLSRLARDPGGGFTEVEVGAGAAPYDPGAELAEAEAEVVEGGTGRLRATPVGDPSPSGFTSFLDGIQRSRIALYHGPVPIVHAYAAAVIRTRRGRRMGTLEAGGGRAGRWSPERSGRVAGGEVGGAVQPGAPFLEEREAVFFPFRLVDPERVAAAGIDRAQMRDTGGPEGEPLPLFPPLLYARAATAVNRWREGLEAELAERWCAAGDGGWLLVDGSLTLSAQLAASDRAVGVIKGHRTRFFDGDDARVLLGLRAGERTSIFQPRTRTFTPVYSWYLRLRSPAGRDVFWGLVRVEVAASDDALARADEISRWLLAETAPLSLPDSRWDRLLYPIRDCEAYLRARAPSWGGAAGGSNP
jgi:hypothetical protein